MTDAPERIWAWRFTGDHNRGAWTTAEVSHAEAQYIRADLATRQRDEALREAANVIDEMRPKKTSSGFEHSYDSGLATAYNSIIALIAKRKTPANEGPGLRA